MNLIIGRVRFYVCTGSYDQLFVSVLRLRSIDPNQNRWRAYEIDLQPTLFGDVSLVTRWGRIGTAGQEKIYHFPNKEEALDRIRQLIRRRRQHGYELTSGGRSLQLVETRDS